MRLEIRDYIAGRKPFKIKIAEFKNHDPGIKKKLWLSLGLGTGVFTTTWGAIPIFAIKGSEWVGSWSPVNLNTPLTLGLIYGFGIAASLVSFNQDRRLLQNKKIEMSQDLPATLAYHGLGKVKFLKEKRRKRSVIAVAVPAIPSLIATSFLSFSAFLSLAALSPDGMREIVILKSGQGVFSLIQSGAAEIVLQTFGREKKKTQNLPVEDVVFEPVRQKI